MPTTKYHKCKNDICLTEMSEGSPEYCPDHQVCKYCDCGMPIKRCGHCQAYCKPSVSSKTWKAAVPEPYYPSLFEKIWHKFGGHIWEICRPICVICGKTK